MPSQKAEVYSEFCKHLRWRFFEKLYVLDVWKRFEYASTKLTKTLELHDLNALKVLIKWLESQRNRVSWIEPP